MFLITFTLTDAYLHYLIYLGLFQPFPTNVSITEIPASFVKARKLRPACDAVPY